MCGIVAYIGRQEAAPLLYEGLRRLEYRGYDSAGIATLNGGKFFLVKRSGRVENILSAKSLCGRTGIGHTRWATHGGATDRNAHPHVCGKFAVVHNGIIENYGELKRELLAKGHSFASETDSEVIAHLLAEEYTGDFFGCFRKVLPRLKGSYALCILCSDREGQMICARRRSPLLLGCTNTGTVCASDLSALGDCDKTYTLGEGETAVITDKEVCLYGADFRPVPLRFEPKRKVFLPAQKSGYPHYMLKEIYDVPAAVEETAKSFDTKMAKSLYLRLPSFTRAIVVGCGTAYHSGLVGARVLEKAWHIPVQAELAGEFCFRALPPDGRTLIIAVSQSGETADTLQAVRLAKKYKAGIAVITNVAYSSLADFADWLFLTQAGQEVGVAATKTYEAQLALFYRLADAYTGTESTFLRRFSGVFRQTLSLLPEIQSLAKRLKKANNVCFIGRGTDFPTALEGSLKLREVSYLNGAGYASGELKHGSIALIDEKSFVVASSTQREWKDKDVSTVREVLARGATVITLTPYSGFSASAVWKLPCAPQRYAPLVAQIPLQFLAYYTAVALGLDPDRPRNLAKSVTVE